MGGRCEEGLSVRNGTQHIDVGEIGEDPTTRGEVSRKSCEGGSQTHREEKRAEWVALSNSLGRYRN